MSLRVENVVFNPKKNDFLINRGGRFRYGSFTKEGAIVIKLKSFDNYFFDPMTDQVYSRRGPRSFEALKIQNEGVRPYYWLFKHGQRQKVYKWEILRDNCDQIENYSPENDHEPEMKKGMKLVA